MLNQEENDPVSDMNTTGEFNIEILYREFLLSYGGTSNTLQSTMTKSVSVVVVQ